ncbi:sulfite reductase flavoprotein subunit alpha [Dyella sp.]|uniref:sulfite reductase subunit alpha n=1 Tax=Dyella sp. TaxID=1869338 RepID=UPI002ED62244
MSGAPVARGNIVLLFLLAVTWVVLAAWHARDMSWSMPRPARVLAAAAAVTAWGCLCLLVFLRRRIPPVQHAGSESWLVAFASQTGFAEEVALHTVQSLQAAGTHAHALALGGLDAASLHGMTRVLFIVSTTGEGDAPDSAAGFVGRCMTASIDLGGLRFGLLALGDRQYAHFCGFGRRLGHWLRENGAQMLFDPVEVDNGDPAALRHWQHHLSLLAGVQDMPDWHAPRYQPWTLVERRLMNHGSQGGACFHLVLQCQQESATWQAGDLVEIGPRQAPDDVTDWLHDAGFDGSVRVMVQGEVTTLADALAHAHLPLIDDVRDSSPQDVADALLALPHREYSIASTPADGAIHLLVRCKHRADGRPGLASSWLTRHAPVGATIALRIRNNANFHLPDDDRPLILMGNGTGLAGLRSLLKTRIAAGHRRHWLLFGERQVAHDFFHRADVESWAAEGSIERLDLAWSRDSTQKVYVQHRLREASDTLRAWVEEGAAIYVCGSLEGMAPGVDAVLAEVLGTATIERLRMEGRYRRDVY